MSKIPAELGPDHLVLSHFSLERHHPLEDRVAAADRAGFDGIGLYLGDVERLRREGVGLDDLADLLADRDLCLSDIEVIKGWGGGPDTEVGAEMEALAYEISDRFASRCLQAVGPYAGDRADAGRAFAALCDRAADHGLTVALEPLPYTNIADLATAAEIVERAGRDNGGVCVDIWHLVRGGDDVARIGALGAERITCVQVSDGPRRQPDNGLGYKEDCLRNRVPPGEGEMDVVGFVAALLAAGSRVPWSVEVPNEATWGRSGVDHAQRCAASMRRVLGEAREKVVRT